MLGLAGKAVSDQGELTDGPRHHECRDKDQGELDVRTGFLGAFHLAISPIKNVCEKPQSMTPTNL